MLYAKIAGAVCLFGAGLMIISALNAHRNKALSQAESFLRLMRYIKNQIDCFGTPLAGILSSFCDDALDECGFLSAASGGNFAAGLDAAGDALALPESVYEILANFARELGGSFVDGQLSSCDYYINALAAECALLAEETPKKNKLCRTVVISVCLMIILLFV